MQLPLAFLTPGPQEMIIILVIGVLLFGSRLPEVGRKVGQGLAEFKKGINGIETEMNRATSDAEKPSTETVSESTREEIAAPKFEAPPSEPAEETADA